MKFDLKFEISDVKYLVKFWGKTFRPARKAPKISVRISGHISADFSETSFQISRLFFGNFVQQKGSVNLLRSFALFSAHLRVSASDRV